MDRRKLLSSLGLGAIAVFATPLVVSISSARASDGSGGSSGGSDAGGPSASGPSASSSGGTPSAGTSSVADVDDDVAPDSSGGTCIVGMNCQ